MDAKRPASRRPYHHGNLRQVLLEHAAEIILALGPAGLSLREVARRAGVSHAAPAHHFGNKRGLLTALAAQGYERLSRCVLDEVELRGAPTGAAMLAATGRGYIRFATENPAHFGVMFRVDLLAGDDPEYLACAEACFGLLMAAVQQAGAEGALGAREPETVAIGAWSIVHGFAALWLDRRLQDRVSEQSADAWAERITSLFTDAVLGGAPPRA